MTLRTDEPEVSPEEAGRRPRRPLPLRLARGTLRVLAGLLGLLAAVLVAAFLILQTDAFRERVRVLALERLRSAVEGRVEVARLGGNLLEGVTLEDVRISGPAGEPLLQVERIQVDYHVAGFLDREIVLGSALLVQPRIVLEQDAAGDWNALKILPFLRGSDEPRRPDGWGSVVRIDELRIVDGRVTIRRPEGRGLGPLGTAAEILDLDGVVRLDRTSRGEERTELALEDVSFRLVEPRLDVRQLAGGAAFTPQGIVLDDLRVRTARSDLRGSGRLRDAADPLVDVTFAARPLHLDELRRFVPDVPFEGRVDGEVALRGPADDLELTLRDVTLTTPQSRVVAEGLVTTARGPRMDATLRLEPLAPADVRELWGGWPIEEPVLGTLRVRGEKPRLEIEGGLAFGGTRAEIAGTLGFAGRRPAYDVRAVVRDLDLQDVLHAPAWRSTVHGEFRIAGAGLGTGADAAFSGELRDSRILFYDVVAGSFRGRFQPGAFVADTFHVVLPRSEIWGSGALPYDYTLALDLRTVSRNLADFYPGIGPTPAARFVGEGTLAGPFSGLDLELAGEADSLAWKGLVADTVSATATFTDLGRPTFEMALDGTAAAVDYVGPIDFATAEFHAGYAGDTLGVTLGVVMDDLRTAEGHLDVDFAGEAPRIVLDRGVVHLSTGDWHVEEPSGFAFQEGVFRFDEFALVRERQRMAIDGTLRLDGAQDFAVRIDSVAVAELLALGGFSAVRGRRGILTAEARVTGTDLAPRIEGDFALARTRPGGTATSRIAGGIGYAERELSLDLTYVPGALAPDAVTDPGRLTLTGTFPVDLAFGSVRRRIPDRPMDLTVASEGLTLALLERLVPGVRRPTGTLELDVRLTGTPSDPEYRGEISVRDGAFGIGPEGPRYTGIQGAARFDTDEVTFDDVRISSATGDAVLEGRIAIRELTLGDIEARLAARRFTLLDEDGRELVVDADVELGGTTREPVVTGTVNVERLEWPLPESTDKDVIDLDEAIVYVRAEGDTASAEPPPDVWRATRLDLAINVEDDAILRSAAALIVLQGALTVEKAPGSDLPEVHGTLEVVRGFYADFGTQFEIAEGEIFFYGTPEVNPGLHIVGTQTVTNELTGQEVELTLTIGGTARQPTLNVSSTPDYEKSEIFSLMLFGTPSPSDPGEAARFESTISRVATRQAALPLQRALVSELGLDLLEIQPAFGGMAQSFFRVGKYVSDDVFVTYSQRVGGPTESESVLGIQYRLSRRWTIETHAGTRQFGADVFYEFRY